MGQNPTKVERASSPRAGRRTSVRKLLSLQWVHDYRVRRAAEEAILKPYAGAGAAAWRQFTPAIVCALVAVACIPYGFFYALTTPWLLVPFVAPLAILALVVIWAFPQVKAIPIRSMERLFFALLVALVVWPNYLAITLPGLPWITINRLVSTPMAFLFLVSLSANRAFLRRIGEIVSTAPVFWRALAVMIALEFLTLPLSAHVGETVSRIVVMQTTETIPFFLGCYIFTRPGRAAYAVNAYWAATILIALIGLAEAPIHHPLWSGHLPSFLQVGSDTVARILAGASRGTTGQYRTQAVFSTPLGLSEFLALMTPFILDRALSKRSSLIGKIAALVTLPVILVVLLGTDSRFGLACYFLSAMLYLLAWALVQRQRNHSLLGTAVIMSYPVLFAAGVASSFVVGKIRSKVWGGGQYDDSTQARYDQFHLALPKMLTHPIGFGVGMGADAIGYYSPGGILSVDSYYLNLTMELGIVGLLAFIIMWASLGLQVLFSIIHSYDEESETTLIMPAAISLAVFLFIKLVFNQDDNHPIVYILSSMIVGLLYVKKREAETAEAKTVNRPRRRMPAFVSEASSGRGTPPAAAPAPRPRRGTLPKGAASAIEPPRR